MDPTVSFARGEDFKSHPMSECSKRFAKPHTVGQQHDRCRAEVSEMGRTSNMEKSEMIK